MPSLDGPGPPGSHCPESGPGGARPCRWCCWWPPVRRRGYAPSEWAEAATTSLICGCARRRVAGVDSGEEGAGTRQDVRRGRLVIIGGAGIGEQMPVTGMEHDLELGVFGLHRSGSLEVSFPGEERVVVPAVHLDRAAAWPRSREKFGVDERVQEQPAQRLGRGLQ